MKKKSGRKTQVLAPSTAAAVRQVVASARQMEVKLAALSVCLSVRLQRIVFTQHFVGPWPLGPLMESEERIRSETAVGHRAA